MTSPIREVKIRVFLDEDTELYWKPRHLLIVPMTVTEAHGFGTALSELEAFIRWHDPDMAEYIHLIRRLLGQGIEIRNFGDEDDGVMQ